MIAHFILWVIIFERTKIMENKNVLKYKDKLLLRKGNEIYYGSPDDKYIVLFRVLEADTLEDLSIAKKVVIELRTNSEKDSVLIRQAEREGLYKAFDIGFYWLEDALANF